MEETLERELLRAARKRLSLGVAVFPKHGATSTGILRAVDAALYRAKREGRSRVVVAD
jgi:diguanylate cyclase (GGDEF)-like protein